LLYFACPHFTETKSTEQQIKTCNETQTRNTCPTSANWSLEEERDLSGVKYLKERVGKQQQKSRPLFDQRKMCQFILSHAVATNVWQANPVAI